MSEQDPPETASRDLLLEIERAIAELQQQGSPVSGITTQLLADIDAVHRAGLSHLVGAIRGMAGDAFLNRLVGDPAIRMLLMSYDLIPIDRRLMAEEALDAVRGHLHGHGVDVEILEVVGGVVYVRFHGLAERGIAADNVARDVEQALREGFIGFQELVVRERPRTSSVQPITLRRAHRPVYQEVFESGTLGPGEYRSVEVAGRPVLIVRTDAEYVAVADRCGTSPLPLHFSTLEGTTLKCSWHGCQYDVRTGARLDAPGERLSVFPVNVDGGKVRVAVDVEPA
jgi:nitrite reductase/ring-hydroxylating ferredoxin subunit/Fe-S cluster biogenesis protein NfuA